MTRRLAAAAAVLVLTLVPISCSRQRTPPPVTKTDVVNVTRSEASWLSEEPIRLLHDYVRIDTSLDHGEEKGAEFLRRFFECEGRRA